MNQDSQHISTESIKHTILIVDDNPTNLKVVSDYLKNFGYAIMVARSGEIALKRVQYALPDIILLDIMMPGIDGFETCRQLKENPHTHDIPVIFMTALSEAEDKIKGFEVGAVDYITKPLQYPEVLARITTHLKLRELARSLQDQNEQLQCLTNELQAANQALSRRAVYLETSSQVGRQAASILDLGELLTEVTELIRAEFNYYFVGVWLWYESKGGLALQASAGGPGHLLEQENFFSPDVDKNIITRVNQTTTPCIVDDVTRDSLYGPLAELTDTQTQLALPLRVGDERIGVLDIRSAEPDAFDGDDQKVLQTLANQIAIAIRNARLYEMEKRINADKDKFFSIISHDLRGPFTSLLGNAQMMLNMADDLRADDIRHMSGAIFNGAKAALGLLDNLLTWSRIQRQGEIDFYPQAITLKSVAQETLELLTPAAADKDITLKNAVDDTLIAYADKNMIDTVIRNLTSNALKFTPRGGSVIIMAEPYSLNGREAKQVRVSVEDTGVGMKQQDLDNLFRLETNFTTLGTEREQGSGLGLIICKEMVEKNGGYIWMESEAGKGTKAQFTLPLPDDGV